MSADLSIRPESLPDSTRIHAIHVAAFGRPAEADLVDSLRSEAAFLLSLIAERNHQPVGHILFTRMWIDTGLGAVDAVALAPMAVLPQHQNRGIGGDLIRHGLDLLRQRGETIVIVLGHAHYYPRFGFSTGLASHLQSPFPADSFMALELAPGALDGIRGRVRYAKAFGIESY